MLVKKFVDIGMTAALLFLMAYEMIGQAVHEWLGIGMFGLFIIHHILNRKWLGALFKGRYTPLRICQTALAVLALLAMLGSMASGILVSRSVLSFLPVSGGSSFGMRLHMLSAYWGFVLMSLHLGLHWGMMAGMAAKRVKAASPVRLWGMRAPVLMIAAYGIYAFVKRDIGSYMFLMVHFVFFDYGEPLIFFLLDYMAVMVSFVCIGHYLAVFMKLCSKKKNVQMRY